MLYMHLKFITVQLKLALATTNFTLSIKRRTNLIKTCIMLQYMCQYRKTSVTISDNADVFKARVDG